MAMSKTVKTPQGFEAINAYHRIENISVHGKTEIVCSVTSYKDKDQTVSFSAQRVVCPYEVTGENVFIQAYSHVKELSEFVGSVDC